VFQDLRYALRTLRLSPGFTLVAVVTLALGIGFNTAIFSVVHAVLLRPMPYPQSERLVEVVREYRSGTSRALSGMRFLKWVQEARSFAAATAYDIFSFGVSLSGSGEPERLPAVRATPGFFATFGVTPRLGRAFTDGDSDEVVISHGLWQRRFGADPGVLGRRVVLAGTPHQIVGVMPAGFATPPVDVWLPLRVVADPNDSGNRLLAVARLQPGVSVEEARAELSLIHHAFNEQYPLLRNEGEWIGVHPLRSFLTSEVRPALLILLGAVGLVLFIACGNVANLLLVRATARRREIAVRLALGASAGRVIRQLLTECLVLALAGGALGILVGAWLLSVLVRSGPQQLPRLGEVSMDGTVLVVVFLTSLVTAVGFGLAPAVHAARAGRGADLREQGRSTSAGAAARRLRNGLVIFEVALCLVLLVSATLLLRSFAGLVQTDAGFQAEGVLTFKLSSGPDRAVQDHEIGARLAALPGVLAAGSSTTLPLEMGPDFGFDIEGQPRDGDDSTGDAQWRVVTPSFFQALRVPLRAGRVFSDGDHEHSEPVVIVNETLVRKHFHGQNPIGAHLTIGREMGVQFADATRLVVGVVGDIKEMGLDREVMATVYLPLPQLPPFGKDPALSRLFPSSWVVRYQGSGRDLLLAIRKEIRAVDPTLPLSDAREMKEIVSHSIAPQRFNVLLLTTFALLALTLAVIGVYGVIAYSLSQRTREIGIRTALGASAVQTLWMVLGETLKVAGVGVVAGVVVALATSRLMRGLLFGVSSADPATYLFAVVLLFGAAALAGLVAAGRALRIDPMVALRSE
jgi:putative ABC transport system permease protein